MKKSVIAIFVFVMMFGFFPSVADWPSADVYAAESVADVVEDQTLRDVLTILVNYSKENGWERDFYELVADPDTTDIREMDEAAAYKEEISLDDLEDYPGAVNLAPDKYEIDTLAGLNNAKSVTSIRLPKNLATIETKAFYEMVGLRDVTMSASVHEIEDSAFEKCEKLVRINIYEDENKGENPDENGNENANINENEGENPDENGNENENINENDGDNPDENGNENINENDGDNPDENGNENINENEGENPDENENEPEDVSESNIIHLEYVYNIGISAFASCPKIEEVQLCTSESGQNIKSRAFSSCTGLKTISTVPNVNLGTGIFSSCHNLAAITFEEGIKKIPDNTLTNVTKGIEVDLPSSLTHIGFYAFEGSNITSIDIDECPELEWIGDYAFQEATIRGWDNSFSKNTKLKTICKHAFAKANLDDMDMVLPDSVTEMGISVFFGATGLKMVTIPKDIKYIPAGTFMGCYDLEDVTVPLHAHFEYVGAHAFDMCGRLKDIEFLKNSDDLTRIEEYAFARCIPRKNEYIDGSVTGLTNIDISSTVTKIAASAFENDFTVEEAKFGEFVTVIPERLIICEDSLSPTFKAVELKDTLSNETTSYKFENDLKSLYSYAGGISANSAIKNITLSKNVTTIKENAFFGNSALELLTYYGSKEKTPGLHFTDSLTSIGNAAFAYCARAENSEEDGLILKGIKNVYLPDSLTELGSSIFEGDYNLDTVILPSTLTTIPESCFEDCGYVEYDEENNPQYYGLSLISDLSGMVTISDYAFHNCYNLAMVTTANGDDYITFGKKLKYLGANSFAGTAIKRASSLSLSKIETIEPYTFYDCRNLEMVYCPDSLTGIGGYAFGKCPVLFDVNFPVYATLSESMLEGDYQTFLTLTPTLGKYRGKIYKVPLNLTISLPATAFARSTSEKISQVNPETHIDEELSKANPRYFDVLHDGNNYKITGGKDQVLGTACHISATISFENSLDRTMNIDYPVDVIAVSAANVEFTYDDFKLGNSKAGPVVEDGDVPVLYVDKGKVGSTLTLVATATSDDGAGMLTDSVDWKVVSGSALTLKSGSVTKTPGDEKCTSSAQFTIKEKGTSRVKVAFSDGSNETKSKMIDVAVIDAISSVDYYLDCIGHNHQNPDSIEMPVGQADKINASVKYSNSDDKRDFVTYSSSNTEVVTVDKDGTIKSVGAGSAKVTVGSASGSVKYTIDINVRDKGEKIDPAYIDITGPINGDGQGYVYVGETAVFTATRFPVYASNGIKWSMKNDTGASMTTSGNKATITGKTVNTTVTLTANAENGNASSSLEVIVLRKATALTFLEDSLSVKTGKTGSIELSSDQNQTDGIIRTPADCWQDVTFTSSDKSILKLGKSSNSCNAKSVTLSGTSAKLYYAGVKEGTAIITAQTETGAKATITVTVTSQPISKITCSNSEVTLLPGKSTKMKLTTTPAKTTETISYKSSNSKVATVDKNGTITAVAAGSATITATSKINAVKATCKVTVLEEGQSLTVSGYTYKINKGNTLTLTAVPSSVKKLTVPAALSVSDNNYNVTKIAASASSGRSSLTSVTIGKNVTTIGKKAFYNCPKLGKVTISTKKLKKVGKAAFKGDKKGMTFKCPKGKVKKYKKLISKSGVPKKSKFKKK